MTYDPVGYKPNCRVTTIFHSHPLACPWISITRRELLLISLIYKRKTEEKESTYFFTDKFLSEKELKQEGMIVHLTLVLVLADGLIVFYGEPG